MGDIAPHEDLARLTALCPPPRSPELPLVVPPEGGPRTIPPSHGELIRTYGVGCFDEFVWVFGNGASNSHLDIGERTRQLVSILRVKDVNKLGPVLDAHHAGLEDLVQWGVTDNADVLAWIATGQPDGWPTVIVQAGQLDAVVTPKNSTAILLNLLTGSLRIPFLPADFPSEHPEFSENPYT